MRAHRALGMPAARLPPREALLEHRIGAQRALEVGLRREAGDRGDAVARTAAALVDALGGPAVALARQDHGGLVAIVADGHELCAVLLDARAVVHEHEVQIARSASRGGAPRARSARRPPSTRGASHGRWRPPVRARRRPRARAPPRNRPGCGRARECRRSPARGRAAITAPTAISTIARVDMASGAMVMTASVYGWARTKKGRPAGRPLERNGGDLLSQGREAQVPSALRGLTALFGMGRGVAPSLSPPKVARPSPKPPALAGA